MRSASISTRTKLRPIVSSLSPTIESSSASLSPAVSLGLSSAARMRGSATTPLTTRSICDHTGSALASLAILKAASAYGRAIVVSSAIGYSSELLPDRSEEVGVRLGVDLALQDLFGTRDRPASDLVAQRFFRARDFLLDPGLGGGEDALGLRFRIGLGGFDRLALELVALRDDFGGPRLRLGQHVGGPFLGPRKALLSLLTRGDAVG